MHAGAREDDGVVHAQGLAVDSVEVRQFEQVVVLDVGAVAALRLDDLGAEFRLHVRVLGEKLEDARECVRSGVHPSQDERAENR